MLVIGVDTQLSAMDDLWEAKLEYSRLHPWIKVSIVGAIIGMVGWIVSLVYLTLAAGRREDTEELCLSTIDKIKTELVAAGFVLVACELFLLAAKASNQEWDVSGLLVASGSISFLLDTAFLIFYLSMVRRLKAEVMWENSLVCWLGRGLEKTFRERSVTVRVLLAFSVHLLICFVLALGAFHYQSGAAMLFL